MTVARPDQQNAIGSCPKWATLQRHPCRVLLAGFPDVMITWLCLEELVASNGGLTPTLRELHVRPLDICPSGVHAPNRVRSS
jgi:hypothetical protein